MANLTPRYRWIYTDRQEVIVGVLWTAQMFRIRISMFELVVRCSIDV